MMQFIQWLIVLALAALAGGLVSKLKLTSILGWLIVSMIFGPHAVGLLPMAVLDDVVAIVVFFTVNSILSSSVSGGAVPLYMIPVMIFLPVAIGVVAGLPAGWLLRRTRGRVWTLAVLLSGITLNYMLMGVSFSAVFTNMVSEERLGEITDYFHPILAVSLLAAIVDLGAPLNYHLILGAGLYTFLYIAARGAGKYFGARLGARAMKMPDTVQKYLGLTLLPHSGVSLVFTGIACSTLAARPELVGVVQGTIAACALLFRFCTRKNSVLNALAAVGSGALFALLSLMGGFMTYNYLSDNLGDISKLWMLLPALLMAAAGIWIARCVPAENRSRALCYAAVALLYFILVIIIMNSLKTVWGRMRFREMTDPVNQFTRWYQIVPRGGFNNIYASFPSGHSMNSAGVILLMLLPPMIPALRGREKALHAFVYVWCVLVGISRVFMGAHFSSDVTVGVLLSLTIFETLRAVLYRNVPKDAALT